MQPNNAEITNYHLYSLALLSYCSFYWKMNIFNPVKTVCMFKCVAVMEDPTVWGAECNLHSFSADVVQLYKQYG